MVAHVQNALIIGASGGIGGALANALEARGTTVMRLSKSGDGLDITDQASVDRALSATDEHFDYVIVASGILSPKGTGPEKSLDAIDAVAMAQVMAINAIGPALILCHAPRLLSRTGRSVVAVLSARVGSIGDNGLGGWYSYRASKAAVNQIVRTAAIEIGRKRKDAIVVALHPGTVETDFTREYPDHRKVTAAQAAQNLLRVIDELEPEQSGGFYDWSGETVPW